MKLCSACLLGFKCRYDGKSKPNNKVIELSKTEMLIPICPEQLGGLSTPRCKHEIKGNKVYSEVGEDVTLKFEKGATETLKIAKLLGVSEVILKQKSPSCGCGQIYDGSFTTKLIEGDGLTTKKLKKNGIKVIPYD